MPALEAMAIISTANVAYKTLKTAMSNGRELADYAGELGKFWDAKEELYALEQSNKNQPFLAKTFGAKSVESKALQISLHKNKIATFEKELRELMIYSGNGALWQDMMKERRLIKQQRATAAREKAKAKQMYSDILTVIITVSLIAGLIALLIGVTASAS